MIIDALIKLKHTRMDGLVKETGLDRRIIWKYIKKLHMTCEDNKRTIEIIPNEWYKCYYGVNLPSNHLIYGWKCQKGNQKFFMTLFEKISLSDNADFGKNI